MPSDRKDSSLCQIADINPETLDSRTPPSHRFSYIDISAVEEGSIDWGVVSEEEFASAPSRARRIVRPGDSMLCTVRPQLLSHAFADWNEGESKVCSTGFAVLRPRDPNDAKLLFHLLFSDALVEQYAKFECGTGYPALNERDLPRFQLPWPDEHQRRRVAAILNTVDVAIERARVMVSAIERLKRALMQQLLPPWIGFKRIGDDALKTGIESHLAGSVCRVKNGSTPSRTEYLYWNNGTVPWIATGKVNERIIRHADEFVTEKALAECSIELLPAGTVLVGMIGQGRTRGMAAYLDMSACINQNFGAFVPGAKVVGKFLYHYLCFHYDRLRDMGCGTNQGALNCYMLKRIRLPLPKPDVQRDIAQVLDGCDVLIEEHQSKLVVLQRLKRGLMQDLLTGKVRVPAMSEVTGA